jgi:hypothetical protein
MKVDDVVVCPEGRIGVVEKVKDAWEQGYDGTVAVSHPLAGEVITYNISDVRVV